MDSEEQEGHLVVSVAGTQYSIVREVVRKLHWRLSTKSSDDNWDLCWIDTGMTPERLLRMKPYQKINHFPGMYTLARKNTLSINLSLMKKAFPQHYNFFPPSWVLPAEARQLRAQFNDRHAKTFIVKPEASCQGRGIFLVRKYEDIPMAERYVVQRYLHKPLLVDGLKFDLRVYVLVAGCNPLRVFVHEEGLARFATEPYVSPLKSNISEMCVHLTNYAVNKDNPNFIFNTSADRDDIGHKKSLTALMLILKERGYDTQHLWREIQAIIVKTMLCAQPLLSHIYQTCQPEDVTNGMCFEILGFDIFLDHKCRPWLLEVNHSPSFTTDTPLDHAIKERVITDALSLLDLGPDNRQLLGKVRKPRQRNDKDSRLERIRREHRAQELYRRLEESHKGGFQKIYPDSKCPEQEELLTAATRLWNERNPRSQRLERREEKPKPKSSVSPFKWQAEPQQEEPLRSSVIAQLRTQARLTVSQSPLQDQTPLRSKALQLKAEALRRLPNGIFVKPRLVALEGLGDSVS